MSRLREILASKQGDIEALRARPRAGPSRPPLDPLRALRRGPGEPLRLIAEIKLRSPSAGPLSRVLTPSERALAYAEAGASMISVLCDRWFFDGSWDDLAGARARLDEAERAVPLLAKEFVLDERQIVEARDRGADAVLLIARIVDPRRLSQLASAARAEALEPLFEVVDEREVGAAVEAGARLIGVNARDLDTLAMDAERAARVCAAIPAGIVAVHLSGLREPGDVSAIARTRVDAALIGEALMREPDPRPRLSALVRAAAGA